ncbi:MAG: hypothetical protein NZP72_04165 [Geminicoccaceae bacterium]|nr:hypothetical protein [Geminicoccaceae bacterium]
MVFEDRAGSPLLACLRPGFRHCFCLLARPCGWIVCDPLKSEIRLEAIAPYEEGELLAHYRSLGAIALAGGCKSNPDGVSLCAPLTCVSLVKRLVGLRAPGVWTPYQLYRALLRHGFAAAARPTVAVIDKGPI